MTLPRAALAVLLVVVLAPLVRVAAAVPPRSLLNELAAPQTLAALRTSASASIIAVGVATLLGVPAAYALARGDRRIRTAALAALSVPLALPPVAGGIALLALLTPSTPLGAWLDAHGVRAIDDLAGVACAEFFVSASIVVFAATAAFGDVDPALEEAARTLGAGPLRVAFTIALPLAGRGIAVGIVLAWLRAIGEYGATSILAYRPASLPIALVTALSADGLGRALALTDAFALLSLLAVVVATGLRRQPV